MFDSILIYLFKKNKDLNAIKDNDIILDIGPKTILNIKDIIDQSNKNFKQAKLDYPFAVVEKDYKKIVDKINLFF